LRLIVDGLQRDLGAELRRAVPKVRVMSMADVVAPVAGAACLGEDLLSVGLISAGTVVAIRRGAAALSLHNWHRTLTTYGETPCDQPQNRSLTPL